MEQNPINIVVALIAMAFVFVGLMQYMSSAAKQNETKRSELFEKWQAERTRANTFFDEKEKLFELVEENHKLAQKWYRVAKKLHKMYMEEKAKNEVKITQTETKQIVTETMPKSGELQ